MAKTINLSDAVISYLASITYTHNFFYGKEIYPLLNCVAWSLEIEVQFYLLMPLLAKIFLIKDAFKRRLFILLFIIGFAFFDDVQSLRFISILNYLHYFLVF